MYKSIDVKEYRGFCYVAKIATEDHSLDMYDCNGHLVHNEDEIKSFIDELLINP